MKHSVLNMKEIVKIVKESLKNDYDAVIPISGLEGTGKSTLSIHLSLALDPAFQIKKNIIFQPDRKTVSDIIYGLPKFSSIVLDEAMRTMYKRNWMTKDTKTLNIIFSKCRKRNQSVFLNIPNFFDLDIYYRNHRTKVWLYLPERGLCMVFMKDTSPFVKDCWYKDQNQKIIERFRKKKKFSIEALKRGLRRSQNYVYEFKFPDLPDKAKYLYRIEADKYAMMSESDEPTNKEIAFARAIRLLREEEGHTYYTLGDKLGFAHETIRGWGMINNSLSMLKTQQPPILSNNSTTPQVLGLRSSNKSMIKPF